MGDLDNKNLFLLAVMQGALGGVSPEIRAISVRIVDEETAILYFFVSERSIALTEFISEEIVDEISALMEFGATELIPYITVHPCGRHWPGINWDLVYVAKPTPFPIGKQPRIGGLGDMSSLDRENTVVLAAGRAMFGLVSPNLRDFVINVISESRMIAYFRVYERGAEYEQELDAIVDNLASALEGMTDISVQVSQGQCPSEWTALPFRYVYAAKDPALWTDDPEDE